MWIEFEEVVVFYFERVNKYYLVFFDKEDFFIMLMGNFVFMGVEDDLEIFYIF